MTDSTPLPAVRTDRAEHMFPALSAAQMARVAHHGHTRTVAADEVLFDVGHTQVPFFIVTRGQVEIARPGATAQTVITVHGPGEFTGEVNMLSGRRTLVRARVLAEADVIELEPRRPALARADRRRTERDRHAGVHPAPGGAHRSRAGRRRGGWARSHCAGTLRVREFLSAQRPPLLVDRPRSRRRHPGPARSLQRPAARRAGAHLPRRRRAAQSDQPANRRLPRLQRSGRRLDRARPRDRRRRPLRPRRRGLRRLRGARHRWWSRPTRPGGQAGSSSRIENYLGFPTGISARSWPHGPTRRRRSSVPQVVIAKGARELACDRRPVCRPRSTTTWRFRRAP